MSDAQRNVLLKGLVTRCGEKQVEAICTWLNLKMVEAEIGGQVGGLACRSIGDAKPEIENETVAFSGLDSGSSPR